MERTDASGPSVAGGNVEGEVLRRYRAGAKQAERGLCCPTEYDRASLDLLPREIVEKDYGCGDPSKYVRPGETVVDLGSGAGKICYILAHKVGPGGRVIGVDFNDDMLALSRKYLDEMAGKLGYRNVRFVKGMIQDLALDLDRAQAWLDEHPIHTVEGLYDYQAECDRLRRDEPLIADGSVDVIVSNCVLNLARPEDKGKLFAEMHRVLRKGGRAVISDIVCDEDPTPEIKADPDLWSGCIAGAMREDEFLEMFERAGSYGVEILVRQAEPWQVIDGIEFRSVTVQAFRGKEGPCIERNQAVIYQGPWKCVSDDDGHTLLRGQRMAVCEKTFGIMTNPDGPYAGQVVPVPPREEVPMAEAKPFDCTRSDTRHPRETKGMEYRPTVTAKDGSCCGPDCGGAEPAKATTDARSAPAGGRLDGFEKLAVQGPQGLTSLGIEALQVNVGLRCNQSCRHCHLECSPSRTEVMGWETMAAVKAVALAAGASVVDITGGSPELNPHLRRFIGELRQGGLDVQVRTNLTVLLEPGQEGTIDFLREHQVRLVASMPCYLEENVDAQRGAHAYERSVEAIRRLNAAGYGTEDGLQLNLVYNPAGPFLPPPQAELEQDYRRELKGRFGIVFSRLLTITNMPLGRFAAQLKAAGREAEYRRLLRQAFNPATVPNLMCRHQVSISWDGTLYDCDFNLALGWPVNHGAPDHISRFDPTTVPHRRIVTGPHCFGCTAGHGSSCGGALA